ncbi:hypothetical protein IU501_14950 [Nocardia otitidiscaviarum]|uniref:hypothetical protein n=1 Tax=Nocardia otitidiscaviarum TaxID=1823 RepID=UPI0004A6E86F|nr:hypothetical protein [Nocardia otitidiscaviarum]MBF6134293.1 hypothetical protein [Nocardia otitidiscaviarum]MBF6236274.1 hypothetical protein [Nocardia otitidiscaviarum]MBF6484044.1 hypothetical protein [Nocardia otitidiscaviarum]
MRIKSIVLGGLLAAGIVAGGAAVAHADYEGTYYTKDGCMSAGQAIVDSAYTPYYYWSCEQDAWGNWDLYLS